MILPGPGGDLDAVADVELYGSEGDEQLGTHTDFDHIGALASLLELNPLIRVITSFVGVGIMGLSSTPLALDRSIWSTRARPSRWATAG